MVTDRYLEETDLPLLQESLKKDEYHSETPVEFFTQEGTLTKVYELNDKPVLVVRASKSLRLDIQYLDNLSVKENMIVMLEGLPPLADKARENGFKEIVFNTSSHFLKKFCIKRLGFVEVEGNELSKRL